MINLTGAMEKARVTLQEQPVSSIVTNTGAVYDEARLELVIPWFAESVHLSCPEVVFKEKPGAVLPAPDEQVLILHYLNQNSSIEPSGQWVSFRELPGGSLYLQPFKQRAVGPLVRAFGEHPASLLTAGRALGGATGEWAEASIIICPLPRLPVAVLLWGGDEEFPAEGNFLFDASAPLWLPTEDYVVLASVVARRLAKQLKYGGN